MRTVGVVSVAVGVLLGGCGTKPEVVPRISGTDRDRVLVEVTYEVDPSQPVDLDWAAARDQALRQCRQWGAYDALEVFGDRRTECEPANRYRRCTRYYVSQTWRCVERDGNANGQDKSNKP